MSYISERDKYWTIYPEHLDYRLSRRLGRKIPLDFAVENPSLDELADACKSLKIPYIIEPDKSHPSNWIERKGRIKVMKLKTTSKRKLLKLLAYRIKLLRKRKTEIEKKTPTSKKPIDRVLKKLKRRK